MFQPKTEAELAEILAGGDGPFVITGGGSQGLAEMGALAEATSLSMGAMRGVTLYEPGALTLVAQAGTPLAEIEAQLAAENQRLAFEPPSFAKLLGHEAGSS
ncbi:MAG: FAD-binding protein, partial [Mangrovicoccus sp.]